VHRTLGPGLLESVYRRCLAYERRKRDCKGDYEKPVALDYDDLHDSCAFRADLLVNGRVVVELKAKTTFHAIDKAQTLSHLRLMNLNVGLLLNFHEAKLVDGLQRIVNNYQGPRVSD
jgi:GxxExxY protein